MHYRGSEVVIVVFDITNAETFENVEEWVQRLFPVGKKSHEYMRELFNKALTTLRLTGGGGEKFPEVQSERVWFSTKPSATNGPRPGWRKREDISTVTAVREGASGAEVAARAMATSSSVMITPPCAAGNWLHSSSRRSGRCIRHCPPGVSSSTTPNRRRKGMGSGVIRAASEVNGRRAFMRAGHAACCAR